MPLVVASQTIPIIAIAPLIVIGAARPAGSASRSSSTYLTFFPVTIAALRGLRAADPRAFELMRSYAASRWAILRKLRLPAALPYLFTAFRIAATGRVVGAIVGELPSRIQDGLGAPDHHRHAVLLAQTPNTCGRRSSSSSLLGIGVFLLVAGVENWVLRHERRPEAAAT